MAPPSEMNEIDTNIKWINAYRLYDWSKFDPEKHMINKIQHLYDIFCSKNGLYSTIKQYEAKMKKNRKNIPIPSQNYIPETYLLNLKSKEFSNQEKLFLLSDPKKGPMLLKTCHGNQGRGIELIHDIQQYKEEFKKQKKFLEEEDEEQNDKKNNFYSKFKETHVIQRCIEPALINGHKFDVRVFILIANVKPLVVLYHPGYCRQAIFPYKKISDNSDISKIAHLTNQGIQKTHPDYQKLRENTILPWNKVEAILQNQGRSIEDIQEMHEKTKKVIRHILLLGIKRVSQKKGQFELLGGDVIYDKNLNPYILELNSNPSLTIGINIS
ncbi:hypothetical protein PPERSA_04400 [Pseudocohnilembus persalinus]|uniref:Tubulin-tyrosine ligase/Tubulin polyglutamylase n=1 Tax=Pseudocohnilembus persalinus TaxID=266149 RepID=A0A0V0QQN7_PSEPJ|nr:hypothetical protein PPERSA_04400 [Pseudocohnilembus persalinus]|eukprot:KRX04585.1 hypothetical protein PPERSA_04400 [Pseudocohnilembus persalinus]